MNVEDRPKRGFEAQRSRREWEREAKIDALSFMRWTDLHGLTRAEAAERMHLSAHTLSGWEKGWRHNRLAIKPRGRKPEITDHALRECILAVYYLAGPGIGLPTLRALFPAAPKRDLEELLQRFRAADLHKGGYMVRALRWWKPGSVWALDHFEPPKAVDGIYRYVLAVRDLASGYHLMALPVKLPVKTKGSRRGRRGVTGAVYRARPAAGPEIRRGLCCPRDPRAAAETRRPPPLVSDLLSEVQWQHRSRNRVAPDPRPSRGRTL